MRARKPEQLSAAGLQAERMNNPAQMPGYFRKLVREQMAAPALERLRQTAMGELVFKRLIVVNKVLQIVECTASEVTQRQALVDLLNIALPRQTGLVDDDGYSQTGVIILPPLDDDISPGADGKYQVVEEEVNESMEELLEDRDEALQPTEETVSPDLVARILAKRKNGMEGRHL
jgi:hypothetical protein